MSSPTDDNAPDLPRHEGAKLGLALNLAELSSDLLRASLRLQGVAPAIDLGDEMDGIAQGVAEMQTRLVHYRGVLKA